MRVITGEARGCRLFTIKGIETVPTSEAVKEAMMNIIQFEIEGARVLDLFAGTGQLGIEALSRGAKSCVFIDSSKDSGHTIRENLKRTRLSDRGQVYIANAKTWLLGSMDGFDIALIDPPYDTKLISEVLPLVAERMNDGGVIITESAIDKKLPTISKGFLKIKDYEYGKKKLTLYRKVN